MPPLCRIGLTAEEDEIKGFSRTIAEIEWLLLFLVLIYLVAGSPPCGGRVAIEAGLLFCGTFILTLHCLQFYKQESLVKLAIESWVMILFAGVWPICAPRRTLHLCWATRCTNARATRQG